MANRSPSFPAVSDMFCGAGGSSQGASLAGAEIVLALNHSPLAISTHASNFPNAKHDCTDVSASDPRRYPSTAILIASPECTNHTIAKGVKKFRYTADLFGNSLVDEVAERSRATMWDVVRFAEHHRYQIVVVENVIEARDWILWIPWLLAMDNLGYAHKEVYLNSMFCLPTPQSRDRLYVVFWRKGQRAPDLAISPDAPCAACGIVVQAIQRWKSPTRAWGRYGQRRQYIYVCPRCGQAVHPFYYPAYAAIDFSIPAPLIGRRKHPLAEKTMARVRAGLKKFADGHVLIEGSANGDSAKPLSWYLPTQTTAQSLAMMHVPFRGVPGGAVVDPKLIVARTHHTGDNITDPLSVFTTGGNHALLVPFVETDRNGRGDPGSMSHSITEALSTITSTDPRHLVVPAALIASYYGTQNDTPVGEAMPTVTATDRHALVQIPFIAELKGKSMARSATDPLMSFTAGGSHHGLVAVPFVVAGYNYGEKRIAVHAATDSLPTLPTNRLHALVERRGAIEPEECGFRMLSPQEIKRGMAFEEDYIVLGNKRQQVKQLGNAVTPPVMRLLMERCLEALYGS